MIPGKRDTEQIDCHALLNRYTQRNNDRKLSCGKESHPFLVPFVSAGQSESEELTFFLEKTVSES